MKHLYLLLIIFSFPLLLQAQLDVNQDTLPTLRTVLRLNLVGLGAGAELPARSNLTLYVEGGFNLAYIPTTTITGAQDVKIILVPYANLQARFFYNLKSRQQKGKRIDKFSANYIGISIPFVSATDYTRLLAGVGPVYGLQRNFGKLGFWGLHIGPGIYFDRMDNASHIRMRFNVNTWAAIGFAF